MSECLNRVLTLRELKSALAPCILKKIPVMIWGPGGIGKSEIIEQICNSMNGLLYDVRLSQCEPTDIRGVPYYNKELGKMCWAPPVELPDEESCKGYDVVFLFLDELVSALPSVQAASYQLIRNRRIGTYKLPDNVVIIAAGNREKDNGVVYKMPAPLANRFIHFEVRADFDTWLEWAATTGTHRDVLSFLSWSKDSLFDFDPKSSYRSFATPRSWDFVSSVLHEEKSTTQADLYNIISGSVGDGMALKFKSYREIASDLPDIRGIMNGSITELKNKDISIMYSLLMSLSIELRDLYKEASKNGTEEKWYENDEGKMWYKIADNVIKFMMDNFEIEINIMGMRMLILIYKLPFHFDRQANYKPFFTKYGRYISGSM